MDCIFCKIAKGEINTTLIYQDEKVLAFDDITPQAPIHKLIIPRKHIATINDSTPEDTMLIGHLIQTAKHIAKENEIAETGYRLVMNCNQNGGQTVFHIHLHLLAGRHMQWPPG